MTLPDWTSAINSQLTAFLGWGVVQLVVVVTASVALGSMVLGLVLGALMRR